jgi:hypothetical protein
MSAFIVDKAHIDALVDCFNRGPRDANAADWANHVGSRFVDQDALGRLLWLENLKSVAARYPDDKSGQRPGPCGVTDDAIAAYEYAQPARRLTIVEAFKAIACYEYQSCEHRGWEKSDAHTICEQLRHALISALPGYDEAAWEIVGEAVPA